MASLVRNPSSPPHPTVAGSAPSRVVAALELVALALEHERFGMAATAVATELATRLGCERVSIGFERRGAMRVEAVSHSATFDGRTNLMRDVALAMDEAADQDATVVHPAIPDAPIRITQAHEHLSAEHGAGAACSVPFASTGRIVGALTLERPSGGTFEVSDVELAEDAAALLGPILVLKRAADTRPLERAREFSRERLARLLGPGHPTFKAAVIAAGLAVVALAVAPGTYRVTADAKLEGRVQRAIVAGLDGYIAEASARAGDVVKRGQVLGRLDERDLVLERRKWAARRDELRKEHREAFAGHDRTQVNILAARLAQADAQIELLDEKLARTRLVAPFDGIVVEGDLSQSLGSPVEKGNVLFEVAPLEGYRIILEVDERDITDVAAGDRGKLALSAMPGEPLALTVEKVTPVAMAEDGMNYFRVEGRLDEPQASLRPGMEGVAKIEIGRRRLLWILTHDIVDWLRLWAWSWWP